MREPALSEALLRAQEQPPAVCQLGRTGRSGPEAGLLPEGPPDRPALRLRQPRDPRTFHSGLTSVDCSNQMLRREVTYGRGIYVSPGALKREKLCPRCVTQASLELSKHFSPKLATSLGDSSHQASPSHRV